jgi:hypothetical protein
VAARGITSALQGFREQDPSALLLGVSDELEVGCAPYVSSEEVARRVAEAERAARAAAAKSDDAPARALQDMMNGTLEAKDAVTALREALVRAPWMDAIPPERYNAEQRAAMEERERAAAALAALLERRKGELNSELARLGGELRDIACGFDERLARAAAARAGTASALNALELYRARLGESVVARGVEEAGARACLARGEALSAGGGGARAAYEAHARAAEHAAGVYEAALGADSVHSGKAPMGCAP